MKTRPRELTSLTVILIGIVVSLPLQIVWLFGDSIFDPSEVFSKLTPLNWAVMGLAVALIPITLRASSSFWIAAPLFLSTVAWNNWLVANVFEATHWDSPAYLSTYILTVIFAGVVISRASRTALTQPGKRWWLTPLRNRVSVTAKLCPVMGGEMNARTFDLSERGAFINLRDAEWTPPSLRLAANQKETSGVSSLSKGSYCWLQLSLNNISALTCTAEIVRKADARGEYPEGVGLRFVGLSSRDKKVLTRFIKDLV